MRARSVYICPSRWWIYPKGEGTSGVNHLKLCGWFIASVVASIGFIWFRPRDVNRLSRRYLPFFRPFPNSLSTGWFQSVPFPALYHIRLCLPLHILVKSKLFISQPNPIPVVFLNDNSRGNWKDRWESYCSVIFQVGLRNRWYDRSTVWCLDPDPMLWISALGRWEVHTSRQEARYRLISK